MTDSINFDSILADLAAMASDIAAASVTMRVEDPNDVAIASALEQIQSEKLNRIRCAVTGAPIATIDTAEIAAYLSAQSEGRSVTADYLLDQWSLNLYAMSTRPGPALQNQKSSSLDYMVRHVSDWAPRLIAYYLTAFAFGFRADAAVKSLNLATRRQVFAADLYDFAAEEEERFVIESLASRLAACDAWLSLRDWHTLGLLNLAGNTKANGIKAERHSLLRALALNPESVPMSIENLLTLIDSMIEIMMVSAANGAAYDKPAGDQSKRVLHSLAMAISDFNADPSGFFPKKRVEVHDPLALAQAERQYSERMAELHKGKVMHSVTHGRGYLPGAAGPTTKTDKAARAAAKVSTPRKKAAPTGKAKARVDAMAAAIAGLFAAQPDFKI